MVRIAIVCLSLSVFLGCDRPAENKVKVTAPGVNVDVQKNGGVNVDAPGVKVNVEKK